MRGLMDRDRRFLVLLPAVVIQLVILFVGQIGWGTFGRCLVFPQTKMLQDFADDISLIDKADDFYLAAAFGTG